MKIHCVWEHNGNDSMIYASNFAGAFTRGETREIALNKMRDEVRAYLRWKNGSDMCDSEVIITQEQNSELDICDADSDVIFDEEREQLSLDHDPELLLRCMSIRSV